MTPSNEPLVGVFTPVYNGEKYLRECIESVLSQTYPHWEYVIVNNCSTDRTREIAESYASRDRRIRVHNNEQFVSAMRNHEIGFRSIPSESKYCKVVHADDWLFPECLARMVDLAEANPSVGVVAAYGLEMDRIVWDGLPYPSTVVPGRDICRRHLLGGSFVFGSPTSVLFRADLVRGRHPFYRGHYPMWADLDACLDVLRDNDFGFVHQVLTFTRKHDEATSSFAHRVETFIFGQLEVLKRHGPIYLNPAEYRQQLAILLRQYRRLLGQSVFKRPRDREFWVYHLTGLREVGHPLGRVALMASAAGAVAEVIGYPLRAVRKILIRDSVARRPTAQHVRGSTSREASPNALR